MSHNCYSSDIINSLEAIPPLPLIVAYAIELTSENDVSTTDLVHALEADPGLTAKILRIANSAYYAPVERIYTVRDAVRFVGFETVRSLAITSAIVSRVWIEDESFSRQKFWRHSLRCGLFARAIAARIPGLPSDILFTIGVLHDIGKVALIHHDPFKYQSVVSEGTRAKLECWAAERKLLGIDHAVVGASLAERWSMPALYRETIASHHTPEDHKLADRYAHVIRLADAFAHSCSVRDRNSFFTPALVPDLWRSLKLKDSDVKDVYNQREAIEEHTTAMFETATRG